MVKKKLIFIQNLVYKSIVKLSTVIVVVYSLLCILNLKCFEQLYMSLEEEHVINLPKEHIFTWLV